MHSRFGLALGVSYGFQEGVGEVRGMCGNLTEVVGHISVEEGASGEKEGEEEESSQGSVAGEEGEEETLMKKREDTGERRVVSRKEEGDRMVSRRENGSAAIRKEQTAEVAGSKEGVGVVQEESGIRVVGNRGGVKFFGKERGAGAYEGGMEKVQSQEVVEGVLGDTVDGISGFMEGVRGVLGKEEESRVKLGRVARRGSLTR